MARKEEKLVEKSGSSFGSSICDPCRSFRQKCGRLVEEQRAKFYIVRRCVAMLLCWREQRDP